LITPGANVSFTEFLITLFEAWDLLAAQPFLWLSVMVVFLVAVESLMFIPYIGFVLKLSVAGVASGSVLTMVASTAAGRSPELMELKAAFYLPWPTQAALAGAALVPFLLGMVYLYQRAGAEPPRFFFSNIFKVKPPTKDLFLEAKFAMHIFALPFYLVTGAVVLKGASGWPAVALALTAAQANWVPILLLGLIALGFEWLSMQLTSWLPKAAATTFGIVLMLLFLAWSFAVMYTVSARVFGTALFKAVS
jgi:hypothetical protein